jgi:Zn-dependent peptidase ImmA (M78 family)
VRRTPRSVRLLGQRIGILRIANLQHEQHEAYGVFSPQEPIIWLDWGNGPERMKVTLMHEILHAALDTSHQTVPEEEDVVGILAPLLLDFLRNNKAVVAYLQESF